VVLCDINIIPIFESYIFFFFISLIEGLIGALLLKGRNSTCIACGVPSFCAKMSKSALDYANSNGIHCGNVILLFYGRTGL
jgi:hypothetical protein